MARQMNRSVAETQAAVSSREFVEWRIFERLHGPGEPERSDLRIALLDWHLRAPAFLDRHRPSPPEMADPASCTTLDTDPEIRGPQRTD